MYKTCAVLVLIFACTFAVSINSLNDKKPEVNLDDVLSKMLLHNAGEFMDGFTEGVDPRIYYFTKRCVNITKDHMADIKKDIKKLDSYDVGKSAKATEDMVKMFKTMLKDCDDPGYEVRRLLDFLDDMLKYNRFVDYFTSTFRNPYAFGDLIDAIHRLFDHEDWYKSGFDVGYMAGVAMNLRPASNIKNYNTIQNI
jgi:CRISPR/Cas system CSM-associated protein Csm2 small subunit